MLNISLLPALGSQQHVLARYESLVAYATAGAYVDWRFIAVDLTVASTQVHPAFAVRYTDRAADCLLRAERIESRRRQAASAEVVA